MRTGLGGAVWRVWFTEQSFAPPGERLLAVVLWRGPRRGGARGRGDPDDGDPDGWSGASDGEGGRWVGLHDRRRVVRALGREYSLPADGRALLLLVEEGTGAAPPAVAVDALDVPVHPAGRRDPAADKAARLATILAEARAAEAAWAASVESHPLVRAFRTSGARDGAP